MPFPSLLTRGWNSRIRSIHLVSLQGSTPYSSRAKFLTDLTLDPPSASSDEAGPPLRDEDYLILSTIHSAKGQESRSVFIFDAVDGCIPSDLGTGCTEDIEEERRLLYVAMTRAKDQLMLMVPQRFYTHQQAARGGNFHLHDDLWNRLKASRVAGGPANCRPRASRHGAEARRV